MIEIKLSQGAKPGHGGVLPAAKVSAGNRRHARRAAGRGLRLAGAAFARSRRRSACCEFVARLRELSGGKPTGFKLAIGHPWEWFGIAKAMHETGLLPDFIVVDGAEGGTGAAPAEFIDHVGVPMHEALMLVHNTLVGLDLRDKITHRRRRQDRQRVRHRAHAGAGRGLVQRRRAASCSRWAASSRRAATPTAARPASPPRTRSAGSTWTWPTRRRACIKFHAEHAACAARPAVRRPASTIPASSGPEHILRRVSPIEVRSLAALYRFLEPGELLHAGARSTPCSASSGRMRAAIRSRRRAKVQAMRVSEVGLAALSAASRAVPARARAAGRSPRGRHARRRAFDQARVRGHRRDQRVVVRATDRPGRVRRIPARRCAAARARRCPSRRSSSRSSSADGRRVEVGHDLAARCRARAAVPARRGTWSSAGCGKRRVPVMDGPHERGPGPRNDKRPACAGLLSGYWWAVQGSNLRPLPCEGNALPLS